MILSDNETKVDLLNNEAIAATVISLLRQRPDKPITVGVHGDWGAGKSSVLEMIEAGLQKNDRVLCLKFNGWRYQGFEDAKIALIEGIVEGLLEKRPTLTKASAVVRNLLRRVDFLKLAKRGAGLALTSYAAYRGPNSPDGHIALSVLGALALQQPKPDEKEQAEGDEKKEGLLKPSDEAGMKSVPEEIAEFRKAFDDLLKAADVDQLVVLIDDLDRCLPDTAIETLEAVRLFVFTSRTAFVVAADEAMIEYAVRKHFPDLPDTTGPQTYARKYLEKLIQVPFRIPALGDTETLIYVTLLLIGNELGEDDPEFLKLIAAARERLKRPWASNTLDAATVTAVLGDKAGRVKEALVLSTQIGPILASGTQGNPRQIKRFLNTLVLRQRTAEARGFGDDVKLPVLAKLMLAERFLPEFFDQVAMSAAAAPDGVCPRLINLESIVSAGSTPKMAKDTSGSSKPVVGGKEASDTDDTPLAEWLSSDAVRAWASVSPVIGDTDLRPYLFVAKDRKDYFGANSVLGHLAAVIEQLLGPKLAVRSLEPNLQRLAVPEAMQVFEALRGRIIGGDSFVREPAGVAGLSVLVKAQPSLQANLLDFLEVLPRKNLGLWALTGWEGVIKDEGMNHRFNRLLEAWAKDGGSVLQTAATGALRTRTQGGR